ncbi:uncharacterized protein LOC108673046 isoform X2 [Hyalella azteca]|uniref:Uncharacterized protein LOC108673046 isoform X2 n=1 Tax=Hyalella azteca TaxID=294128 RepID=A0A979FXJ7_HYAAZ|nr:uncharacterized protein LOC108673046 isoform X2 [Hyalella azteca]
MCFSSVDCDCQAATIFHLQESAKSSEARGVSGRDVVLGAAQCSSPHGGKMSSSRSLLSPPASTPATAAASYTEPSSNLLLGSPTTSASFNTPLSPVTKPAQVLHVSSSFNTLSKELESSGVNIENKSISFSVNSSSAVIISTSLEPTACGPASASCRSASPVISSSANTSSLPNSTCIGLKSGVLAQEPHQTTPKISSSDILGLGSSVLVPAVCWQQAEEEVCAALYDLGLSGRGIDKDQLFSSTEGATCGETRPPVLGEEQKIGEEEDFGAEHNILMQGEGWGECPAVEGSGEGESPETGSGGVGGSLEGSSSCGSNVSSNPREWSQSIDHLLSDPNGVSVFMNFLKEENGCCNTLDFFFACKGLERQPSENLRQLLPLIWKKFIRNYNVRVSPETHADLAEKIHQGDLSADMFRVAQREALDFLRETSYPVFLQSQMYVEQLQLYYAEQQKLLDLSDHERRNQGNLLQQNQNLGFSSQYYPKQSEDHCLGSSSLQSGYCSTANLKWGHSPGALPTLYEHETPTSLPAIAPPGCMKLLSSGLRGTPEDDLMCLVPSAAKRPQLSSKNLAATAFQRAAPVGYKHDGDTGYCGSSSKLARKEKMLLKDNLRLNEELRLKHKQQQSYLASAGGTASFVVPRTQLPVCPSTNLAKHPEQFARVLTEKLEAVLRKREGNEKVQRAFKKIQESEGSADVYRREHAVNSLPPSVLMNKIMEKIPLDDDVSEQAILDQHVSRVWQDSSRGSPVCFPSSPPRMMSYRTTAPLHHHHHHFLNYNANASNAPLVTKNKASHVPNKSSKTPFRSSNYQGLVQQSQKAEHQYPLSGTSPYTDYPASPSMPPSRSLHHLRSRDQNSMDVYGAFSSDSGTVPDFRESSARTGRRHQPSGVSKTRSVPENMMDSCAGSGSERYPSSSGSGSRGRTTGGGGSELTDSGVSVISDSRHSLLTTTQPSSVHQRVETWLQDTSDSSGRKLTQSLREPADDRTFIPNSVRCDSSSSTGRWQPQQQQQVGAPPDHLRRRHRAANTVGAAGDVNRRANTASPAAATSTSRYGGTGGGATSASAVTSAITSCGTNSSGTKTITTTNAPTSDRNTSSSSGSTMRKPIKASSNKSTTGGGGGSDGQSSCSRGSDGSCLTESTTVVYSFCDDSVPFVIKIVARSITLKRFKQHLPKRGNYRFFFKKHCEEFGVIQEEMTEDEEVLPIYEGRIFAQIRKAD